MVVAVPLLSIQTIDSSAVDTRVCVCVFVAWVQDLDAKTQAEIDREVEALMKQMGDQSADWQRNLNALGESVHGTYRPWMSELEAAVRAEIERLKARGQGVSAKELERRLAELRAKLESLSAGGEAVRVPAGLSACMLVVFCFHVPSCRPLVVCGLCRGFCTQKMQRLMWWPASVV